MSVDRVGGVSPGLDVLDNALSVGKEQKCVVLVGHGTSRGDARAKWRQLV